MDRKKILILILALILLVGSIFFAVLRMGDRNQEKNIGQNPAAKKKSADDMLSKRLEQGENKNVIDVKGNIESVLEKTLKVKDISGAITIINISADTPVEIVGINKKTTPAQLSDLRIRDLVKVTYDKMTINATLIQVERL
jgi:hypothetical protein